jgi:hypothetical protein
LRNVLIRLLEDQSWIEYQIKKEVSKEELIVELVPIHLGITDSTIIKNISNQMFNKMMSDITVITGNQLKNKLNHNSVKFAGDHD